LPDKIAKILKPTEREIVAIFFDLDRGASRERTGAEDVYQLQIVLLYGTAQEPVRAEKLAEDACQKLCAIFAEACQNAATKNWEDIELVDCAAISDEAMSFADSQKLKQWNLDYLSLRADPAGEMLS
jgi:hypothetical protein